MAHTLLSSRMSAAPASGLHSQGRCLTSIISTLEREHEGGFGHHSSFVRRYHSSKSLFDLMLGRLLTIRHTFSPPHHSRGDTLKRTALHKPRCWLTNKIKTPALINRAIKIPPMIEISRCRRSLGSSFDPAAFCPAPIPNQKRSLSILTAGRRKPGTPQIAGGLIWSSDCTHHQLAWASAAVACRPAFSPPVDDSLCAGGAR